MALYTGFTSEIDWAGWDAASKRPDERNRDAIGHSTLRAQPSSEEGRGFLSDALKFLSPFSLLRLLDVSNKSKNEKDKHDDRVLKGLSANAARNLVDFRINGQNLSAEDVSRLTSGFRNSIVNVSANTLPLISLSLSGNTVKIEDLQYLLSVSPYLRELQLDECQLDVFEVMNALQTPKCRKLELLSLRGNRFGNTEVGDGKGFGELENLSSLNLSMCQGKGAATAICSIWTALKVTENFKRGCSLIIRDCGLSDADAKTLISHLSDSSRIRSLNIEGNHFSDETKSLLEALLQNAGLHELSISTSGKTRLQMSTIAKLLNAPECTVRRLKLGKMTSNDEIVPFLTCLADKNPLELLDISEYTLKDADASAVLRLLWGTEKEFTLVFNPSNMKQAQTLIENFVSRKSVHSTFETLRKYEDANRMIIRIWKKTKLIPRKAVSSGPATPFPESERLVSELVNPPSDVLMAQEKLSSSIARLQLRLPAEDLSYLSTHLPDVDIAKNAIEEYRSTPSLHVELLDSALDPTVVAKARANVLKKVTQALKDALEETAKDTIESVFNELKPVHGKEFCSVHPRAAELVDKVESLFNDESSLLQKQLSQLVTPMILGVNARLVQQMYTYILEAISTDVQNCLEKLPERSELISRPSAPSNSDEYAQISDLPAVKSETISPPIEESPSQEAILVTHFTKSPTSSSPPAKELVKGTGVSLRPKESIASDKAASKRLSGHRKSSEVDAASKRHSGNRRSTEVDAGKIGRISSRPLPVPLAAPPTTPAISMGAEPTKTDASGDDEGSNVTSGGPLPCLTAGRPKPARKTVSHKIFVSDDGERISGPVTSEGLYDVPEPAVAPSQNVEEPPAEEVVTRSPPTRKPGCLPPGTVRPPSVQPQVLQGLAMNLRTRPRPPPVEAKTESEPEWIAVRKKITQSRQISQSSIAETPSETVHEEAPTATTSPTATTWEPKRELPQLKPS
nr:unnamed protein product [Spirometra erinaceieuropaei]